MLQLHPSLLLWTKSSWFKLNSWTHTHHFPISMFEEQNGETKVANNRRYSEKQAMILEEIFHHLFHNYTRLVWKWSPGGLSALRQLEITRPPASWIQRDGGGTPCLPPTPLTPKVSISNRAASLLELLVLGAPRLGQEALCQLLQVAGVVHLDLSLLTEEVLEVLQQLYPELTLLVQAFHLLRELSADLCNESKRRQSDRHLWKKPRCQHSPLPSRCSLCSGELKGFTFKNVMRGTTTNSPTFQTLKEYWNRESAKSVKKKLLIRHMILRAAF